MLVEALHLWSVVVVQSYPAYHCSVYRTSAPGDCCSLSRPAEDPIVVAVAESKGRSGIVVDMELAETDSSSLAGSIVAVENCTVVGHSSSAIEVVGSSLAVEAPYMADIGLQEALMGILGMLTLIVDCFLDRDASKEIAVLF